MKIDCRNCRKWDDSKTTKGCTAWDGKAADRKILNESESTKPDPTKPQCDGEDFKPKQNSQEKKKSKKEDDEKPELEISFLELEDKIVEQVLKKSGDRPTSLFVVLEDGEPNFYGQIERDGILYSPYHPINNPELIEGAVLLPEEPQEYESLEQLIEEIKKHIYTYTDLPDDYLTFSAYYILLTWVYDKVNTLPYLRVQGDTGCGKSRFLDVVGRLCYKATLCSGSITPAPIYRMIRKWQGTIILDEADLRKSDETNEVVTILNCGFERGRPVLRSTKDNPDNIQTLPTFSPKILSTRGRFSDTALEARCLTHVMTETDREDIPYLLPPAFYEKERELRNKLLMFRLKNRDKIDQNTIFDLDLGTVEPRLKQATASFAVLFANIDGIFNKFREFLGKYQDELIEERSQTWEGMIVRAIYEIVKSSLTPLGNGTLGIIGTLANEEINITPTDIKEYIKENFNQDLEAKIIGKKIKSLGLETKPKKVEGKKKNVVNLETGKLPILFKRYVKGFKLESTDSSESSEGYGCQRGNNETDETLKPEIKSSSPSSESESEDSSSSDKADDDKDNDVKPDQQKLIEAIQNEVTAAIEIYETQQDGDRTEQVKANLAELVKKKLPEVSEAKIKGYIQKMHFDGDLVI